MAKLAEEGSIAVVTGAAGGIGAGIAKAAAKSGMKVILTDIVAERLEETAESIRKDGGQAIAFQADISDENQVDDLCAFVRKDHGPTRLLVNNAAVEVLGQVWEVPASTWKRAVEINLLGVANGLRSFVPGMIAHGQPAWVSNVSSIGILGPLPMHGAYLATKAAILATTEALKIDLDAIDAPITVSAVLPHGVATRIIEDAYVNESDNKSDGWVAQTREHLKNLMTPEEAGSVIFKGIESGSFWISTHPDQLKKAMAARARLLEGQVTPVMR